jgi:hypothetical protein
MEIMLSGNFKEEYKEPKTITNVMNVKFEQTFILPNGNKIKTGNE